jgi:hypothetical protein
VRENHAVEEGASLRQRLESFDLIGLHQTAIARDVSRKIAASLRSVSIGFAKTRPLIRLSAYRGISWHDTSKFE